MLDAARDAIAFMHGKSRSDLDRDRKLLLAVVKCIEIIGEAAAKVSAGQRTALPTVPWPAITGMRNRLIHGYYDIDHDQVSETVAKDLPPLVESLRRALGES
jgi:uncharacterized protein with HEPN domain